MAIFRYERLPIMCFNCDFLFHDTPQCKNPTRKAHLTYKKHIRAEFDGREKQSKLERLNLRDGSKDDEDAQDIKKVGKSEISSSTEERSGIQAGSNEEDAMTGKLKGQNSEDGCADFTLEEETQRKKVIPQDH